MCGEVRWGAMRYARVWLWTQEPAAEAAVGAAVRQAGAGATTPCRHVAWGLSRARQGAGGSHLVFWPRVFRTVYFGFSHCRIWYHMPIGHRKNSVPATVPTVAAAVDSAPVMMGVSIDGAAEGRREAGSGSVCVGGSAKQGRAVCGVGRQRPGGATRAQGCSPWTKARVAEGRGSARNRPASTQHRPARHSRTAAAPVCDGDVLAWFDNLLAW